MEEEEEEEEVVVVGAVRGAKRNQMPARVDREGLDRALWWWVASAVEVAEVLVALVGEMTTLTTVAPIIQPRRITPTRLCLKSNR